MPKTDLRKTKMKRRPGPRPTTARVVTRSCRVPESAWLKYTERAHALGIPPARVMTMLVEAFAAGALDLPGVRYVFEDSKRGQESASGSASEEAGEEMIQELGEMHADYDPDLEI